MQDILREKIKIIKAIEGYTYKDFAEYLNIKEKSFYNWLYKAYDLGEEKYKLLNSIATDILE